MADSRLAVVVAAPAEPARKRGRPKGSFSPRVRTVKFSVLEAVDSLADTAANTFHPGWEWDGKAYPKTKRSHGPNMDSLNRHSPVLKILFWLAPNGYPDPYKLRDVWIQLHGLFKILGPRPEGEALLSLSSVAALAADRWRIMCKHCLLLVKGKQYIPRDFTALKEVMALINVESEGAKPPAAPAEKPPAAAGAAAAASRARPSGPGACTSISCTSRGR